MRPRTILLATDLSHRSDRALDRAAMLAGEWQARLVVVHAIEGRLPEVEQPAWRRPHDPLEAARRRILRDLPEKPALEVDVVVERGEPADVVLDAVERRGAELVVTGVARSELLGRILLGTTVETLARRSKVPLLVVKSRPRGPYRNVVVATDFSEGSRAALETALALLPSARVTLFHAAGVPLQGLMEDRAAVREAALSEAAAESAAFLAATPAAAGRAIEALYEHGEPGPLLQDLVDARGVDLVVLGTEGRSGLAGILMGSVAERLLDSVPVDVLVVRRPRD